MNNLKVLIDACQWMNDQRYSPATSGNYSLRIDAESIYVSASGVDKGRMREEDFIQMGIDGSYDHLGPKPSDEALIHAKILELNSEDNCVLHSHSIPSTALTMFIKDDKLEFQGFELQKAFSNVLSHEEKIVIPIYENTQDIESFAKMLGDHWLPGFDKVPCLILRGHGVYVWAESIHKAKRYLEGIEFLMAVRVEHIKMGLGQGEDL